MKKNIYYRSVIRRSNPIKEGLYSIFFYFCSIPRLLLEVFIRKNFGERYFSFSTGILTAIFLGFVPVAGNLGIQIINRTFASQPFDIFYFLLHHLSWYIYLAGFVAMCIDRAYEIQRLPNVYDFGRFSLSTGQIDKMFLNLQLFGSRPSVRTIETLIEPLIFFIPGLVLILLQQHVGYLLVWSSVCYSMSYLAAYNNGDNFVMDQIDEMIFNEEITNSFIDGLSPNDTRGVNYYGRKPADPEMRRKMAENIIEESDIVVAL